MLNIKLFLIKKKKLNNELSNLKKLHFFCNNC